MNAQLGKQVKPLTFQVTFLVEPDEVRFHAWAPMLKGLHADGKSVKEALQQACELAQLYLESLIEDGEPIPLGPEVISTKANTRSDDVMVHLETVTVFAG